MNTMTIRQGDVGIAPAKSLPANLEAVPRTNGRVVLSQGSATGHAHAISSERAQLFRDPKAGATFLQITGDEPVSLDHEEHAAIPLDPGVYEVIQQREYTPQEIRSVAD